ncbi:MAG: hypothetical protein GQ540_13045 [Lutibacter sp.]|uniref:CotH kinase family protein n=1 Tax=Lutibacter sp. TaxID=1925666 RepID=UPI001A091A5E|nr:CotH kinase family protein [Lutibacter sp.]NOR29442.1 hypothetical protein [Lutibacter sp.]
MKSKSVKNSLFNFLKLSILIFAFNACNNENEPEIIVVENIEITEFSFLTTNNPTLISNVYLTIEGNKISGRIPQNIDVSQLAPTFEFNGTTILVNNVSQLSATTKNDFTNIVTYIVKALNGSQITYDVDITKFTGLPVIYLTTDNNAPIDSKDDYIEGDVIIEGGRNFSNLENSSMKIRGRGNSTWYVHPKKPYQLKLGDEGEVLGMPEEKKWLFLAEYSDKTMMRNSIAFEMGYLSNLDWTPESDFAEVFINDNYNGTYNITQKVEEGANRVNLEGNGYLLEIDQLDRLDPDDVFFYTGNFLINIKAPDLTYDSTEYNYVKNLLNEFESVLNSDQFKDPTNGYAKYIDIDSFIDWYLISEITKNVDSKDFSSIFLNVIPGEKIKMGPLWDFDLAFGNVDYADSEYAEGFWVKDHKWYARLFEDEAFVTKVKARFEYFSENKEFILDKMDFYANQLKWSQQENDMVWGTLGIYVWPNPVVYNTYEEEVNHLKSWYSERMNWLENTFNSL